MYAIGVDIGTTTICALVFDCGGAGAVKAVTVPNDAYIEARAFESLQDPQLIFEKVKNAIDSLVAEYGPIVAIGLSCQMHGIVYVDADGNAASPLYTWQDGRGDQAGTDGAGYAGELKRLTGCGGLATGYGAVTHFYNVMNGLVPREAAGFCSIGDYAAMRLTGKNRCASHQSNAASFGLFDLRAGRFDAGAIAKGGMDPAFFPAVERGCAVFGETAGGVPVSYCIGDNQASYIGSVASPEESVLINVGTGGQISVACGAADGAGSGGASVKPAGPDGVRDGDGCDNITQAGSDISADLPAALELRPLIGDRFIQVGAILCGGRAYAALENFFAQVLDIAGAAPRGRLYEAMNRLAENEANVAADPLAVSTRFSGTRQSPDMRGGIYNLGLNNFTPAHFTAGVIAGIAEEFYELYGHMEGAGRRTLLVGSGNGLRKNRALQKRLSERFGMPLLIPEHTEEAAFGAALYALAACERYAGLAEAQAAIRYVEA